MIARQKIPNYLTYARMIAVPITLGFIMTRLEYPLLMLSIFVIASLTDYLDGYLARKWNATSKLGAMLDPMADKLLVALMLIYLLAHTELSIFPVAVILLRELYIAGLREFLAHKNIALPVSQAGKFKTALQMVGISLVLAAPLFPTYSLIQLGGLLLWFAAAFAIMSAIDYSRSIWHHLH